MNKIITLILSVFFVLIFYLSGARAEYIRAVRSPNDLGFYLFYDINRAEEFIKKNDGCKVSGDKIFISGEDFFLVFCK